MTQEETAQSKKCLEETVRGKEKKTEETKGYTNSTAIRRTTTDNNEQQMLKEVGIRERDILAQIHHSTEKLF